MSLDLKRVLHSLWIIPSTFMFINGLPLIFVGFKANKLKWSLVGLFAELPLIVFIIISAIGIVSEDVDLIFTILMLISIIVTVVYSLSIRNEYLNIILNDNPSSYNLAYNQNNYNSQNHTHIFNQENKEITNSSNQEHPINNKQNMDKSTHKININTADIEELEQLPGFNPILANKIVHARNQKIVFNNIDELGKYLNIESKNMQRLIPYLDFKQSTDTNTHQRRLDI